MRKRKTRMGSLGGDRARIQGPRPRRTSARAKRSKSKVRLQPGRTRRNPGPPPWGASRLAPKSLPSQGCTSAPRAGQRVYLKRSPRPITAPQVRGCASCTSKSASALHLEHGWPPRAVPTRMYLKLGRYPRRPRPRDARGALLRGNPSTPRWTSETWCRMARSSCCSSNLTHFANGQSGVTGNVMHPAPLRQSLAVPVVRLQHYRGLTRTHVGVEGSARITQPRPAR